MNGLRELMGFSSFPPTLLRPCVFQERNLPIKKGSFALIPFFFCRCSPRLRQHWRIWRQKGPPTARKKASSPPPSVPSFAIVPASLRCQAGLWAPIPPSLLSKTQGTWNQSLSSFLRPFWQTGINRRRDPACGRREEEKDVALGHPAKNHAVTTKKKEMGIVGKRKKCSFSCPPVVTIPIRTSSVRRTKVLFSFRKMCTQREGNKRKVAGLRIGGGTHVCKCSKAPSSSSLLCLAGRFRVQ